MVEYEILSDCCKQRDLVRVFLMNGYQLKGNIIGFDDSAIILLSGEIRQLIYKHAISTIEFNKLGE
jgi:host factor-I protein